MVPITILIVLIFAPLAPRENARPRTSSPEVPLRLSRLLYPRTFNSSHQDLREMSNNSASVDLHSRSQRQSQIPKLGPLASAKIAWIRTDRLVVLRLLALQALHHRPLYSPRSPQAQAPLASRHRLLLLVCSVVMRRLYRMELLVEVNNWADLPILSVNH